MPSSITMRLAFLFSLGAVLAACGETGDAYYAGVDPGSYPPANGPGEKMDSNEIEAARRITAIIEAHLDRLYPHDPKLRDAHPKSTGCVDAVFTVREDVPVAYRKGIFASPGRSYRAVIRFSNSNENAKQSDAEADGRGMAIKLFDLDSSQKPMTVDPLASLSPRADTPPSKSDNMRLAGGPSQDFIMISHPTFLVADPDGYRRVFEYTDADNRLAELMLPLVAVYGMGISGVKNLRGITSLKIDNPLSTRYWSTVPYQLGNGPDAIAIKFSADFKPVTEQAAEPARSDRDFLRHAMAATLQRRDAKFVFEIQPRTSSELSVEDPRIEWTEQAAPFYPVADIVIHRQTFDTVARNAACEVLSYSPWHALPEHKPLGAVNRMRKGIYESISAFRRGKAADVPR